MAVNPIGAVEGSPEIIVEIKGSGPKGDTGVSISDISRTSGTGEPGTTDTYTITLTNGATHDFTVYNGANGEVPIATVSRYNGTSKTYFTATVDGITEYKPGLMLMCVPGLNQESSDNVKLNVNGLGYKDIYGITLQGDGSMIYQTVKPFIPQMATLLIYRNSFWVAIDHISLKSDEVPTKNSINLVQSGGVFAALAEKITAPSTASVGQAIVVKTVDDEGKPTEWETVDLPSGGTVDVDATLSEEGKAADAAAVGERLSTLSEDITSQVATHNTGTDTHSDIRLLIQGLTNRLNALADSDDTTLDQLSEVVAYIKSNRELISAITTDKVSVSDIIDNLTTNVANKPLSAAQGVALKALIDAISIPDKLPNPNALTFTGAVEGSYDGSEPKTIEIPSGGGTAGWELINEVALTEDEVSEIEISEDSNGNLFELSAVYAIIFGKGSKASGVNVNIKASSHANYQNTFYGVGLLGSCLTTDGKWSAAYIEHIVDTYWNTAFKGNAGGAASPATTQNYDTYMVSFYASWTAKPDGNIRGVKITPFSGTFSSGAKLILYGKRV